MRIGVWHAVALVVAAVIAAAAALLLIGPIGGPNEVDPDAANGEGGIGGALPAIPAPDPVPWRTVAWERVEAPFREAVEAVFGSTELSDRRVAGAGGEGAPLGAIVGQGPMAMINGLVDGGDLLLAPGRAGTGEPNELTDVGFLGAVYISDDGRAWRAIPIVHGVNDASVSDIFGIAVGTDAYLAYGSVCCQPEARAVWRSEDGVDWRRLEIGGDLNPARVYFISVVGFDDGFLATTQTMDGRSGFLYHSPDGATWETVLTVERGMVVDVERTKDGLVAVGTIHDEDGGMDGAVWTSSDGHTWERRAAADPTFSAAEQDVSLHGVVAHAGGVMVVGSTGNTAENAVLCEGAGMVASTALTTVAPALTGCAVMIGTVWTSADLDEWQRIDGQDLHGERPQEFRLMAAGGPGIVVLGESSLAASPDTTLFTSEDGVQWTAIRLPQPMHNAMALGFVVRGRSVIAITDHWNEMEPPTTDAWLGLVSD